MEEGTTERLGTRHEKGGYGRIRGMEGMEWRENGEVRGNGRVGRTRGMGKREIGRRRRENGTGE
jgi:hypothetical protein